MASRKRLTKKILFNSRLAEGFDIYWVILLYEYLKYFF